MAQFDIYGTTGEGVAYLLDLQDEMLEHLSTRVVAPLALPESVGTPMKIVNPRISVGGVQYLLLTHLLAAIPAASLGQPVASAKAQRDEIVGAVDFLFTGI
jgi:toxin CcdB